MRKNIFRALCAVVAVTTAGFGSYQAYCSYVPVGEPMPDLLLVEDALASGENNSNSKYKFDGGFRDCKMSVSYCANCGMSVGAGKCSITYNMHFMFLHCHETGGCTYV